MSDFFTRLAERAQGTAPLIAPAIGPVFAPGRSLEEPADTSERPADDPRGRFHDPSSPSSANTFAEASLSSPAPFEDRAPGERHPSSVDEETPTLRPAEANAETRWPERPTESPLGSEGLRLARLSVEGRRTEPAPPEGKHPREEEEEHDNATAANLVSDATEPLPADRRGARPSAVIRRAIAEPETAAAPRTVRPADTQPRSPASTAAEADAAVRPIPQDAKLLRPTASGVEAAEAAWDTAPGPTRSELRRGLPRERSPSDETPTLRPASVRLPDRDVERVRDAAASHRATDPAPVHVHIGTVEVRSEAPTPVAVPTPSAPRPSGMTLDEYLKSRDEGRR